MYLLVNKDYEMSITETRYKHRWRYANYSR